LKPKHGWKYNKRKWYTPKKGKIKIPRGNPDPLPEGIAIND
jgi:hypothetical protein